MLLLEIDDVSRSLEELMEPCLEPLQDRLCLFERFEIRRANARELLEKPIELFGLPQDPASTSQVSSRRCFQPLLELRIQPFPYVFPVPSERGITPAHLIFPLLPALLEDLAKVVRGGKAVQNLLADATGRAAKGMNDEDLALFASYEWHVVPIRYIEHYVQTSSFALENCGSIGQFHGGEDD